MLPLTIGMAHFDDYDGVYFTIQHLRTQGVLDEVEYLVVDQTPDSPHGTAVRELMAHVGGKYVPLPAPRGTSPSRNRVFAAAAGELVMCLDSHVLIRRDSIAALRAWFAGNPGPHLVSGPMLADSMGLYASHFNDQWRAEMWGTWGMAWSCDCGAPLHFSVLETDSQCRYVELLSTPTSQLPWQPPVTHCPSCGRQLPELAWPGHEAALVKDGWHNLVVQGEPFEVPGMGLGCFAMRRADWVGFHPRSRGFGGEELYVHEKVRRAGGRVMCLPQLGWLHRFGRPGGVKYPLTRPDKVANYVWEYQELGWDPTPIREHFEVDAAVWQRVLADPDSIRPDPTPPQPATAPGCAVPGLPPGDHNLDTIFQWVRQTPRDLEQHADKIRELASQVRRITAFVKRREWDAFILAGRPERYVSYQTERDGLAELLATNLVATETNPRAPRRVKEFTRSQQESLAVAEIDETDLLVIDTVHHGERLAAELQRFAPQVTRWIVLRGTALAGETAEGGNGPGLLPAMRNFMRAQPEWSVVYHTATQYGLTLLSRDPADKPQLPGVITMAANFAKALAEHVADGVAKVSPPELTARLEVCTICDQRRDDRCTACGCFTAVKAAWRSSECPLGRWSVVSGPLSVAAPAQLTTDN